MVVEVSGHFYRSTHRHTNHVLGSTFTARTSHSIALPLVTFVCLSFCYFLHSGAPDVFKYPLPFRTTSEPFSQATVPKTHKDRWPLI